MQQIFSIQEVKECRWHSNSSEGKGCFCISVEGGFSALFIFKGGEGLFNDAFCGGCKVGDLMALRE